MSIDIAHLAAAQLAAALGTAAQMVRTHRDVMAKTDPTLAPALDQAATILDTATNAVGKIAWAPLPVPPVSSAAGGGT
jgi:hypothetical protein